VSDNGTVSVDGALGSIRRLEQELELGSTARAAADARLRAARAEAARLLDAARVSAAAAAAERRLTILAAADDDAAAIEHDAEVDAARLRADARATREAAVDAALALILPGAAESEA
jgi:hypothetical protein